MNIKITIFFMSIIIPLVSFAGVKEEMMNFLGESQNVSDGGYYESQTRGYFAAPSMRTRNRTVSFTPFSVHMPSISSGCNGIDMYTGALSYVNLDKYLQLLQAIPKQAGGYAFKLALETMSPSLMDSLNDIESTIRKINGFNLNSCEIGKGLVDKGISAFKASSLRKCVDNKLNQGAKDYEEAKKLCTSEKNISNTLSTDPNDNTRIVDVNYAWESIKRTGFDNQMKEFLQTITGTIIVKKPANDDSTVPVIYKPSLIDSPNLIEVLMYGEKASATIYKCDEYTKCLNLSVGDFSISPSDSFHNQILTILTSVSEKMRQRDQELTTQEKEILSATKMPIIAILRTYTRYFPQQVSSTITDSLAEMVAYDILMSFLSQRISEVEKISFQDKSRSDPTKVKEFQDSIYKAKKKISMMENRFQKRREQFLREVNNAQKLEKILKTETFKYINAK